MLKFICFAIVLKAYLYFIRIHVQLSLSYKNKWEFNGLKVVEVTWLSADLSWIHTFYTLKLKVIAKVHCTTVNAFGSNILIT